MCNTSSTHRKGASPPIDIPISTDGYSWAEEKCTYDSQRFEVATIAMYQRIMLHRQKSNQNSLLLPLSYDKIDDHHANKTKSTKHENNKSNCSNDACIFDIDDA